MVEAFGPDFTHVYIDSETEDRLGRYINNGRTEREFLEAECHPVESNVSKLASLAHLVIVNSGGLEEFTAAVSGIVDQLGDRGGHLSCQ